MGGGGREVGREEGGFVRDWNGFEYDSCMSCTRMCVSGGNKSWLRPYSIGWINIFCRLTSIPIPLDSGGGPDHNNSNYNGDGLSVFDSF